MPWQFWSLMAIFWLADASFAQNLAFTRATYLEHPAVGVVTSPLDNGRWVALNASGQAQLHRYTDASGTAATHRRPLATGVVRDLAMDRVQGHLVVGGDFGVQLLPPDGLGAVLWQDRDAVDRVAIAPHQTVATLSGNALAVYSPNGTRRARLVLADFIPRDLAVDPITRRVFVIGYRQATATLKTPVLRAFDLQGDQLILAWRGWDFPTTAIQSANLGADSEGLRLEIGDDRQLYFLGSFDGGNTVFARDPQSLDTPLDANRLINPDAFTNTSNTSGAKKFTVFGRLRGTDGQLERAQMLVTRLSAGGANSFTPTALAADALGNVFIGGSAAASLQNRDARTLNSQPVGAYTLGEMAVFSVTADFRTRRFWSPLTAPNDPDGAVGSVIAFTATGPRPAFVGTVTRPAAFTLDNEPYPQSPSGYFAVLDTVHTVTNPADSGPNTLRDVLNRVQHGDTVVFNLPTASVIPLDSELVIDKSVQIDGRDVPNLTLSGRDRTRLFRVASTVAQPVTLALRHLILSNGNAGDEPGGAIHTIGQRHTLILDSMTLADHQASEGGAIYSRFDGTLTVSRSRFLRNRALRGNREQAGGAIFFQGPDRLTVHDTEFTDNQGINGGAINNLAGRVVIERSRFVGNHVLAARFATGEIRDFLRGYGGAIYSDRVSPADDEAGGEMRLVNNHFENNRSRAAGGALYLYTGSRDQLTVINSRFLQNQAVGLIDANDVPRGEAGNGGALELQSDAMNRGLVITGSLFHGNRAVDRGGAVRLRNVPAYLYNNTFDDNRTTRTPTVNFSGGLGGALELSGGSTVRVALIGNTFSRNFAAWTGGAVLGAVDLLAENNIFDRNTTETFADATRALLSHVDSRNVRGGNNLQFPDNRGQTNNDAVPGGTQTADPRLAPLADNGGFTRTRALLAGSPALDGGNRAAIAVDRVDADGDGDVNEAAPFDQRGVGFARVVGATVDIGAFEGVGAPIAPMRGIATRGFVGSGEAQLFGGLALVGSGIKRFLITAKGPSLAEQNVVNPVADVRIALFRLGEPTVLVAENDDWATTANVGEIPAASRPTDAREAALLVDLGAGLYTPNVSGANGAVGIGLLEIYDLSPTVTGLRIQGLATRGMVGAGENQLIGGVALQAGSPNRLLITAKGPSISGVAGRLADPQLAIPAPFNVTNNDWRTTLRLGEIPENSRPTNDLEAAIVLDVDGGTAFTPIVSGGNGATGVGIVEMYELP